jgi:hypothetical protein
LLPFKCEVLPSQIQPQKNFFAQSDITFYS